MSEHPVCVVTGGAEGIGFAIAQIFATRNFITVLADIDGQKACESAKRLGSQHKGIQCDVTSEADVKNLAQSTANCRVLVNNTGIGDSTLPTLEQNAGHFRRVLDVHLTGTYLCSREFARNMITNGGGAIVNISSIAAFGGIPGRNAYGAAKAGISMMTQSMACEWARFGIRVNAIAPGYTRTALLEKLAADGAINVEAIERRSPMGRLVQPEELAEAVWFLASSTASAITGTTLNVDGGWSAFGAAGNASE